MKTTLQLSTRLYVAYPLYQSKVWRLMLVFLLTKLVSNAKAIVWQWRIHHQSNTLHAILLRCSRYVICKSAYRGLDYQFIRNWYRNIHKAVVYVHLVSRPWWLDSIIMSQSYTWPNHPAFTLLGKPTRLDEVLKLFVNSWKRTIRMTWMTRNQSSWLCDLSWRWVCQVSCND